MVSSVFLCNLIYLRMVSSVFYCSLTYSRMSRPCWNWFVCGRFRHLLILCRRMVSSVLNLIYERCRPFSWRFLFALSMEGGCNPTFCTLYATDFYPSFIWPTRLLVNLYRQQFFKKYLFWHGNLCTACWSQCLNMICLVDTCFFVVIQFKVIFSCR